MVGNLEVIQMGIERSATGSRLLRSDRDCPRL